MYKVFNLSITCLFLILATASCSSQRAKNYDFEIDIIDLRVENFDEPVSFGFGEKSRSYQEALVAHIIVSNENMAEIMALNNMPLLFIGNHSYNYIREEEINERGRTLVFHIPNWRNLEDGLPMSYSLNHANPHRENGQLKYNSNLIRN